ncbi:hypothetical protein N431DRAFT_557806 [Stipitochalara longipes BDJ]|nr:hypothetical protein N431DRAFT_557806 [Stipitochalara longipes BDJ]
MSTTISCAIDGPDITGMQVTLRCRGYSPTTFKGYGYVDGAGRIGHDLWQFQGSRSSAAMEFLEEDERRIWVMAFDTGSSYPVTNNFIPSEFESGVENTCVWPAIEINFTFGKGDQVLISLQLGQQSYTCSRTLSNALQAKNRTALHPSSRFSRNSATHRHPYRAAIPNPSELTGKQDHRVWQSLPSARLARSLSSMDEETSSRAPRLYKMISMPSCSKKIIERTDKLELHKDKLKDWLSDDKRGKFQKIWEQKTFPLALSTLSREMESAEILLELSRVSDLPAQLSHPVVKGVIESGTESSSGSLEDDSKHAGTSSTNIMTWVDQVNELFVEDRCLPAVELPLLTGPSSRVGVSEVNWEDNKRTVSECEEDTIVVDIPETKKSRRTRLSVICEGTRVT